MVLSKTIEHDHQAKNLDKTGCINFSDKTEHNDEDNTGNNVDRGKTERGSLRQKRSFRQTSCNGHSEQPSILITLMRVHNDNFNKTEDQQDNCRSPGQVEARLLGHFNLVVGVGIAGSLRHDQA